MKQLILSVIFMFFFLLNQIVAQNVGVGTAVPTEKFHVLSEDVTVTGSSISNFTFTKTGCASTTGDIITTGDNVTYDAFGDVCGGGSFEAGLAFSFNAPTAGNLTFEVQLDFLNYNSGSCALCKSSATISSPSFTFGVNGADQTGSIAWSYAAAAGPCPTCSPAVGGVCDITATASVSFPLTAGVNTIEISRIRIWPTACPDPDFVISLQDVLFGSGSVVLPNEDIARFEGGGNLSIGDIGFTNDNTYKLYVNGNAGATGGFSTASDARFKTDVSGVQNALDKVMALEGVSYQMLHDNFPERNFREGRQYGFLAQDVCNVLPEIVTEGTDGYLSLQYDQVVPVLVEAIKALNARIETLEAENSTLKAGLRASRKDYEARLKKLEQLMGERAER